MALSYGFQVAMAQTYASRYQVMTSNQTSNVQPMHAANPSLPMLGYLHPHLSIYNTWCAEAQSHEQSFLHTSDPASLTATPSSGSVRLSWLADARLTFGYLALSGYNVYRRVGATGAFQLVTPTPISTTTYTDTGLTDGTLYGYKITSVDRTGAEQVFSSTISVAPGPSTQPVISPVSLTVTSADSTVTIAITVAAASLTGIDLYVDTDRSRTFSGSERFRMSPIGTDAFGQTLFSGTVILHQATAVWGVAGCQWYAQSSAGNSFARLPATGYFSTGGNNRIRSAPWGYWIMDPADTTWQAILCNAAKNLIAQGYDGIFLDDGVTSPLQLWPDCTPLRATIVRWPSSMKSLMSAMRSSITPASIVFNGLSSSALSYLDASDGGMVEGFVGQPWYANGAISGSVWEGMLDTALRAEAGRTSTQLNYAMGADTDIRMRLYCLGSHLLISNAHTFFCYDPASNSPHYYPEWDVALGDPLASYGHIAEAKRPSGLYGRAFTNGLVLVNASDKDTLSEALAVPLALVTPTGGVIPEYGGDGALTASWVTSVHLRPREAVLLLNTWTGSIGAPSQSAHMLEEEVASDAQPSSQQSLTLLPNPVVQHLELRLNLPLAGRAHVSIYDAAGRRRATLLNESVRAGQTVRDFNLTEWALAPGVYMVVCESPAGRLSRRFVLRRVS
jgi:hypothetical protein